MKLWIFKYREYVEMERYVKYKDSGIDWIGEIPEDWEVKRLRYVGSCQNGVSKGADYFGSGYPFINYTDVYANSELPQTVVGLARSSDEDRINYSVQQGDIFFTRTSETIEEIGFSSTCTTTLENAIFSGFLIRFRPFKSTLFERFSKYYFRSQLHRLFFVKEMNLVTRASLSQELLKKLPVLLPPLEEQKTIARHLDHKTAEIDQLIAQKERLIELYEEEKTAIINQAVTKGINLDVKLKASGVDWLGDIPEHWEIEPIKYSLEALIDCEHKTAPFVESSDYFVVRTSNVRNGKLILDKEQKAIAEYIETETTRIDAKIAKTKRIIELQKEYRTAPISEAVIGKIKVPQLP